MKIKLVKKWGTYQKKIGILLALLLVMGIFFRFINIDRKVYWDDEATNSLRTSGYTEKELFDQVYDGRVIGIEDLQKYQYPSSEKTVIDTIKSLAVEESQSPPLYYVMARFWMQWVDHSPTAMRSLSALISLLAFPSIYWLCLELFELSLVGWIAIALLTVSPFHVIYAQEARLYSLWTVTILLSSAALLRAIRLKTKLSWGTYAAALAVGLYTFPFTALVAIGHGVYVFATERFRLSKTIIAYLLTSLVAVIVYSPWIFLIITNSHKIGKWREQKLSLSVTIEKWALNFIHVFLDFNFERPEWTIIVLIPIIYAIYFLVRHAPLRVWLFIVTLIGVTELALILPDLLKGGIRSTIDRYLIPCYLGIELAVAFLIASKITVLTVKKWQYRLWQVFALALISCGVISCAIHSQAVTWWNKGPAVVYVRLANIINQADRPLLISDGDRQIEGRELALSYLLEPKVKLILLSKENLNNLQIPNGFSDVFVFDPSGKLLEQIKKIPNRQLESADRGTTKVWLWRV
ncbi:MULTISPECIES: glycosyltransferase family 39 protein [Aerosakkonema]|uniref:glycosyltransferase family 39 protein n=1 Tax=Aerosakkonema TaxID=1246629 RepID=UPI0035B7E701